MEKALLGLLLSGFLAVDFGVLTVMTVLLLFYLHSVSELGETTLWGLSVVDGLNQSLVLLTLLVCGLVLLLSSGENTARLGSISCAMSVVFFSSNNLLVSFISFEISVIPLLFLVVVEGKSPERVSASFYMIIYTLSSSVPFFVGSVWLSESGFSSPLSESVLLLLLGVSFLVKVPLFLLHGWLPRAHVEASLCGSMLLAGVLLNLGVLGIVRVMMVAPPVWLGSFKVLVDALQVWSLWGSVYSFTIALTSDDLNKSVAYSSVGHINLSLCSLLSGLLSGVESSLILSFVHGATACCLFWNVTVAYQLSHSRSVLVSKGIFSRFGHLHLASFVAWIINISPPLTFPFVGEVGMVSSVCSGSGWVPPLLVGLSIFAGSSFSILNYVYLSHSGEKLLINGLPLSLSSTNYSGYTIWMVVVMSFFFFFPLQAFPCS